jgi:hypothetical protein
VPARKIATVDRGSFPFRSTVPGTLPGATIVR